jgi:hypothetical protein
VQKKIEGKRKKEEIKEVYRQTTLALAFSERPFAIEEAKRGVS